MFSTYRLYALPPFNFLQLLTVSGFHAIAHGHYRFFIVCLNKNKPSSLYPVQPYVHRHIPLVTPIPASRAHHILLARPIHKKHGAEERRGCGTELQITMPIKGHGRRGFSVIHGGSRACERSQRLPAGMQCQWWKCACTGQPLERRCGRVTHRRQAQEVGKTDPKIRHLYAEMEQKISDCIVRWGTGAGLCKKNARVYNPFNSENANHSLTGIHAQYLFIVGQLLNAGPGQQWISLE